MSLRLVFATGNLNKLSEVQAMVPNHIELLGLNDINCNDELPETHDTLEENASEKAWYIYNGYKFDCFSEDTGLEIAALNGAPGVLSARYAGAGKSAKDNMDKVLHEMQGISDRKAKFRTIISLIIYKVETQFEGIVEGIIAEKPRGEDGFGYDPIFIPNGYDQTFAEMGVEEKNTMSHRKRAFSKLIAWLKGNEVR